METSWYLWAAYCSVCPSPKKVFSYVWMEFSSVEFGPIAFCPATSYWILVKGTWIYLLNPSHQVFIFICSPCPNPPTTSPPTFVFSRLNRHNLLRLSLSVRCCKALSSLWPFAGSAPVSPHLLSWGAQHRAQSPSMCSTAQEPVAFFAAEVHCWLVVTLVSSRSPRAFLKNLLFRQLIPRLFWGDYCSPGAGLFPLHCWASWDSCWPFFSLSSLSSCFSVAAELVFTHGVHTGDGALCPTTQVNGRDVKQCGPSSALSHANTTSERPLGELCVTGHSSEHGRAAHFQPTSLSLSLVHISWVICGDIMGLYVKSFVSAKASNTHSSPFLLCSSHVIIECCQVGQELFPCYQSIWCH